VRLLATVALVGIVRLLAVLPLLVGMSACVMYLPDTPPVSGTVLSKKTRQPVANAEVSIASAMAREAKVRGVTDVDGSFSLPAQRRLMVVLPIGDLVNGGHLTVEHPEYQKVSKFVAAMAWRIDLREPILLTPLP